MCSDIYKYNEVIPQSLQIFYNESTQQGQQAIGGTIIVRTPVFFDELGMYLFMHSPISTALQTYITYINNTYKYTKYVLIDTLNSFYLDNARLQC